LFIRADGLKVVVATRFTEDRRDEQPASECPDDAIWSSGDGEALLDEGRPVAEVAAGFGLSERTARKWQAELEQFSSTCKSKKSDPV